MLPKMKNEKNTPDNDLPHPRSSYDEGQEGLRPPTLLGQLVTKVSGSSSPSDGEEGIILFDVHCHLHKVSSMKATDRKVEAAKAAGVTSIAICATCPQDWDHVISTSKHLSDNNLNVVLNFGGELVDTLFYYYFDELLCWVVVVRLSNFILLLTQFIRGISLTTYWRRFVME